MVVLLLLLPLRRPTWGCTLKKSVGVLMVAVAQPAKTPGDKEPLVEFVVVVLPYFLISIPSLTRVFFDLPKDTKHYGIEQNDIEERRDNAAKKCGALSQDNL